MTRGRIQISFDNLYSLSNVFLSAFLGMRVFHTSSSSSSCRAASTDIPDPLSPLLPIIHRLRQVFRVWSQMITQQNIRTHVSQQVSRLCLSSNLSLSLSLSHDSTFSITRSSTCHVTGSPPMKPNIRGYHLFYNFASTFSVTFTLPFILYLRTLRLSKGHQTAHFFRYTTLIQKMNIIK